MYTVSDNFEYKSGETSQSKPTVESRSCVYVSNLPGDSTKVGKESNLVLNISLWFCETCIDSFETINKSVFDGTSCLYGSCIAML